MGTRTEEQARKTRTYKFGYEEGYAVGSKDNLPKVMTSIRKALGLSQTEMATRDYRPEEYEELINLEGLDRWLQEDIKRFAIKENELGVEIAKEARRAVQDRMLELALGGES